jgi:lipoprotein-releasing system permease protein
MRDSLSGFIGFRYAGVKADTHLLSFLSRVAMLGLVFGVALLIVVLSVMNGFDRELRERILNIVPHISIYHDPSYHEAGSMIDWAALELTLKNNPAVREVIPFIEVEGLLKGGDKAEPLLFYGVESYPALQDYVSKDDLHSWQNNSTGLLVGAYLAEKLHLSKGDEVIAILSVNSQSVNAQDGNTTLPKMKMQRYQVAGVFDTKTELDKALAISHQLVLQSAMQMNGPQGFRLQLYDLFRAPIVQWQLLQNMPASFYGRNWSQTHGNLYEAVQMSRALVSLLMFVIIAVAVFNIVSTLILVVIEKKQAIAILRVQGATRGHIVRIFMVQGTVIGLMGSCIGATIGMLVSWILPDLVLSLEHLLHIQFLKTEVYPISYIPSDLRISQVIAVVVVATVFSFLTSLYPAWRATRVDAAQVLRYE